MAAPRPGDSILVLRPRWLELVLSGEKKLEIRSKKLSPGQYCIGTMGKIHGRVRLQTAMRIHTAQALTLLNVMVSIDVLLILRHFVNSVICIVLTWMNFHIARPTASRSVITSE